MRRASLDNTQFCVKENRTIVVFSFPKIFRFVALALFLSLHAFADTEKPKSALGIEMEAMNKSLRLLRRQVSDPSKKDSSLALVANMEKNAATAKSLVPARAKDVPENEREKFIAGYQSGIDELIHELAKVEEAIRGDRGDESKKLLDELQSIKRKSHEEFSAEQDD